MKYRNAARNVLWGVLLVAAWFAAPSATASQLYVWEGEGCFYYNQNIYGGDGQGGCGLKITGSLRMPDSYVRGTVFDIDAIGPDDELPSFYMYLYVWAPFHPEVRSQISGSGDIWLPVTTGPASIFWNCGESCTSFGFWTQGDSFRWYLDEVWNVVGTQRFTWVPTYVPEPGTLALLGLGLAGLGLSRRRKAA